jgi:integral membrane sensor domain MASE1
MDIQTILPPETQAFLLFLKTLGINGLPVLIVAVFVQVLKRLLLDNIAPQTLRDVLVFLVAAPIISALVSIPFAALAGWTWAGYGIAILQNWVFSSFFYKTIDTVFPLFKKIVAIFKKPIPPADEG